MEKTITYLIDNGHSNIIYLGYAKDGIKGVEENPRFKGYMNSLRKRGIDISPDHLLFVPNWNDTLTSGYEKVKQLVKKKVSFTAIAACNDLMAIGAIRALHDHGIRVPEDVSVTGFDDLELASMITPALTTVSLPKRQIGHSLMNILLRQLKGENIRGKVREYSADLKVRESVKTIK
jgi:DNA-binding LacI/PurR family transcriptional regulator